MSLTDDLYQEIILDHCRHPRHFVTEAPPHTHTAKGLNPLCGDQYEIYLSIDATGMITAASFSGSGCAISKASASLMTDALIGKSTAQASELIGDFRSLVSTTPDGDEEASAKAMGKLAAFGGIWKFPSRVKCAVLCWHAAQGAMDGEPVTTTEEQP
jgi:nitrogen fixation NifU-like protein